MPLQVVRKLEHGNVLATRGSIQPPQNQLKASSYQLSQAAFGWCRSLGGISGVGEGGGGWLSQQTGPGRVVVPGSGTQTLSQPHSMVTW